MASEKTIKKHFKEIAEQKGWTYWFPPNVKWHESDIFGVGDVIVWIEGEGLRLIQYTTTSNRSARRKKIRKFLDDNKINCSGLIELWAWDDKKKVFKIELIE